MKTLLDVQELIGVVNAGTFSCGTKLHRFIAAGIPAAEAFEAVKAEQRALIDRVSQLDASIKAFREAAAKPDPEKWDDIEAFGAKMANVMFFRFGDDPSLYSVGVHVDWNHRRHYEERATIAEALNAIRRKINIPER